VVCYSSDRQRNDLTAGDLPARRFAPPLLRFTLAGNRITLRGRKIVGSMLRRRRSYRKKRSSAEAVCIRWPKVPLREASVLQTDLKIE
jgi:hypothetical protein